MIKINPYRPGAGLKPMYLAGREEEISEAKQIFEALSMKIPTQSIIYSGLRGVGKTVLINKLYTIAEAKGIFCRHIEIEEKQDFIAQIAACAQTFLREISIRERIKHLITKSIDSIKSLVVSFDPNDNTFSLSVQERELYKSNSLTQSLTDVFVNIGAVASETETPLCFFIDEIQYMKSHELGALIAALHRSNQMGYPIMIIGAGLPKIYKMLSEEKSYTERLFMYKEIGSLDREQSIEAIAYPVKGFNVEYTDKALNKIIDITKGYPYFIQQFCQIIYNNTDSSTIDENDVENSTEEFFDVLDKGFFKVRYERCSEMDKKFIFAMVRCGELPCTISNVAKNMNKTVKSISPIRAQLINKGLIYAVRHSELDFTVPEFDGFIKRQSDFAAN
ncbi:MAG TPA: ATP-binding protein [Candidatus Ornithomonoglobus intestinigallinarum]|uniref:ATP-binding protein n=1 Tax=Candidatus Ornithomonoglobus intestinigallinarum TaxID=2840894 RepID=A0A9D1H3X7_9FIRM|nr:ATP-binding protein [Candidatus Ornithomonoglobus intestinigallinarum]